MTDHTTGTLPDDTQANHLAASPQEAAQLDGAPQDCALLDTPPLVVSDLTVTYPDGGETLTVLDHVNFAPQPGQLTAITGSSGSGKSTLLTSASLLTAPTSGTIMVNGKDAWALSEHERTTLRRDSLGIVFQQPNLFASLTAREQLLMSADIRVQDRSTFARIGNALWNRAKYRRAQEQALSRANEMLALVGLQDKGDLFPHQLSGGQRQRVNIARALMSSPQVLLADEPTSALDEDTSEEVLQLLHSITRELNVATVLVTHDRALLRWCDTSYELQRGHLTLN